MNRRAPFLDHEGSDSSQFLGTCCPGGPSSPRPIPRSSLVLAVPGDPPPLVRFLPVPWYLLDGGACRRTQNVGVHCILRVMQCVHSMQRLFNANLPRVMPLPCRRPPRGSRRATQSSPRRPPRRWSRTRRSAHQAKHTRTACYAHTILLLLGETTATQPLYYKLAEARSREYEQCVSIVSRNLSIDFSISEMRR